MNLIAVVFDIGQVGILLQFDFDGTGEHLLAREHDGMLDRGVEIAAANFGVTGARGLEEIGEGAADAADFEADIFYYGAGRAGGGGIAADDFGDSGDSG